MAVSHEQHHTDVSAHIIYLMNLEKTQDNNHNDEKW